MEVYIIMYTTEGVVLRKQDSGEADAIFVIYTKDFGKIRALAQGVKKEGAKLKGHLEPLNWSALSFVMGRNGERLTQASLINYWSNIRGEFQKLKFALMVADLVDRQCLLGERDEKLWALLTSSLLSLEERWLHAPEGFLEDFKKKLALVLGYAAVSDLPDFSYNGGHG